MAVFNTSQVQQPASSVGITGSSTPAVANVSCLLAGTEYSFAFPDGVNKFKLQARGLTKIQMAFASGDTGTTYFTIGAGSTYEDDLLTTSSTTVYFQCNQAAQVVEIIYWI